MRTALPANTKTWPNVVSMLVQRRWRWVNIETALGQILTFAGLHTGVCLHPPLPHHNILASRSRYDVNHLHILTCEVAVSRVGSVALAMVQQFIAKPLRLPFLLTYFPLLFVYLLNHIYTSDMRKILHDIFRSCMVTSLNTDGIMWEQVNACIKLFPHFSDDVAEHSWTPGTWWRLIPKYAHFNSLKHREA